MRRRCTSYRETMLLSGLGILAGYGFGAWLRSYIVTESAAGRVHVRPGARMEGFRRTALVVGVVAVLGWVVYRRLKTVDMLARSSP